MTIEYTITEDHEYEVSFVIGGNHVAMAVTVTEVEAEAEDFGPDEPYAIRWTRADVALAPIGTEGAIWNLELFPEDLDTGRNYTDAQLSDICDEIAGKGLVKAAA